MIEFAGWNHDPTLIQRTIPLARQALALDPFGQDERIHLLGYALYTAGRYQEASEAFKRIPVPKLAHHAFAAACSAELGDDQAVGQHTAEILRMNPAYTISSHLENIPYRDPAHREHFRSGLVKAGLPE